MKKVAISKNTTFLSFVPRPPTQLQATESWVPPPSYKRQKAGCSHPATSDRKLGAPTQLQATEKLGAPHPATSDKAGLGAWEQGLHKYHFPLYVISEMLLYMLITQVIMLNGYLITPAFMRDC